MEREWGNGERMRKWREIHFLHFLILSLFPPSLSISCIKNCLILSQNVKYDTFVAKNLTYAQWENNFRSNSQRESSLSCEGLNICTLFTIHLQNSSWEREQICLIFKVFGLFQKLNEACKSLSLVFFVQGKNKSKLWTLTIKERLHQKYLIWEVF